MTPNVEAVVKLKDLLADLQEHLLSAPRGAVHVGESSLGPKERQFLAELISVVATNLSSGENVRIRGAYDDFGYLLPRSSSSSERGRDARQYFAALRKFVSALEAPPSLRGTPPGWLRFPSGEWSVRLLDIKPRGQDIAVWFALRARSGEVLWPRDEPARDFRISSARPVSDQRFSLGPPRINLLVHFAYTGELRMYQRALSTMTLDRVVEVERHEEMLKRWSGLSSHLSRHFGRGFIDDNLVIAYERGSYTHDERQFVLEAYGAITLPSSVGVTDLPTLISLTARHADVYGLEIEYRPIDLESVWRRVIETISAADPQPLAYGRLSPFDDDLPDELAGVTDRQIRWEVERKPGLIAVHLGAGTPEHLVEGMTGFPLRTYLQRVLGLAADY